MRMEESRAGGQKAKLTKQQASVKQRLQRPNMSAKEGSLRNKVK